MKKKSKMARSQIAIIYVTKIRVKPAFILTMLTVQVLDGDESSGFAADHFNSGWSVDIIA